MEAQIYNSKRDSRPSSPQIKEDVLAILFCKFLPKVYQVFHVEAGVFATLDITDVSSKKDWLILWNVSMDEQESLVELSTLMLIVAPDRAVAARFLLICLTHFQSMIPLYDTLKRNVS